MQNYSINIAWSDKDEGFIATVPEFQNLSAFGKTYEEALVEAKNVLEGYIEVLNEDGVPLPAPDQLSNYSGQVRLRMPKTLHYLLALQSQRQAVSLNTYMVSLLSHNHGALRVEKSKDVHVFVMYVRSEAQTTEISTNQVDPLPFWGSHWQISTEGRS